jgi:hypothetical protein
VNNELFFIWLKDHFFPREPTGKVLLILNGNSTDSSSEAFEFTEKSYINKLCLPSHTTTHYLQPLDRSLFKSPKAHYCEAVRRRIYSNPDRKITLLKFFQLQKAVTNKNATAGFEVIEIFPLNKNVFRSTGFIC